MLNCCYINLKKSYTIHMSGNEFAKEGKFSMGKLAELL